MAASAQPVFSRATNQEKADYDRFFEYTNDATISSYGSGYFLENLAALAEKTYAVLQKTNPILSEGTPQNAVIPGRQWELDRLSDVKQRLAKAIDFKRAYYENHPFGIITKYVLKCFGMWHNGDTAAIQKAEDFLILYDSRMPMLRDHQGNYRTRFFYPLTPADWVRTNLDTRHFYNYNPRRPLPAVQNFRFDALDNRDPQVVIRAIAQSGY